MARTAPRRPPTNCPVCNTRLAVTRLSCPSCSVSYPTARARFDALLARLGIERPAAPAPSRVELMEQVARGEIDIDEAMRRLDTKEV